ncbi:MAG: zinc-ribbon domain-containing protein [Patescibacteria group bacterium]
MFELYDYQKPPLKAVNQAFETQQRVLMVMASGLGKTVVSAFWAKDHLRHGKMLFLCHENEILAQALSIFRQVLGETVSLGVFTGQQKDYEDVDALFASFQTFREWKEAFFPDEFATIIVDESHHGQAPTFREVIEYFTPQKLLGMTATPDRMDEKDIREIFGDEVVNLTLEEGIAKGWLTPVEYHVMTDDLDKRALNQILQEVLKKGQRISIKQLNETIFVQARDEEIARIIQEHDRKTIIFCEGIDHPEDFAQYLPGAECFHSEKNYEHNDRVLKAFKDGTLQYILAVDKFNEGIDIPDAEMVVFLRCTDSKTVFLQQLGRGLRKAEGKDNVVILDFVANCHRLIAVRDMVERVKSMANVQALCKDILKVTGEAFDFLFTDEQQDIFEVLEAIQPRYVSDIPHLLAEYSGKNELPPDQVIAGTMQQLLWECQQPECRYEWKASGHVRLSLGTGCPACSNRVVTNKNNLAMTHLKLANEYSDKNELPANQIVAGTSKKIWWRCSICGHEWRQSGSIRVRGAGCPSCANKVLTNKNNLAVTHPELAEEYSDRNELPANKIFAGTNKKLLWKCRKCGYEWQQTGNKRVHGTGCPACANQIVTVKNNLAATHPRLAREYSGRNKLPVDQIKAGSNKKVLWKCMDCSCEWEAVVNNRKKGSGCPKCSRKRAWVKRRKK